MVAYKSETPESLQTLDQDRPRVYDILPLVPETIQ
jgi:hypothetical protein